MKRTSLIAWLVLPGLLVAATSQAATVSSSNPISIPQDAVGITEKDFQELKDSKCYFEEMAGTIDIGNGEYCDPLLAQLHDKVIFRAHHYGEMYWMNIADGLGFGPHRYLPDGIYKSNDRYFLVSMGIKKRLRANSAYDQVVAMSQKTKFHVSFSTPMNETDWNANVKTCAEFEAEFEEQRDALPYSVVFGQCEREEIEGIWQNESYLGQMILRVEDNGSLYYVRPNSYWATVHAIKNSNAAVMDLAEDVATPVRHKVMKKLIPFAPIYN